MWKLRDFCIILQIFQPKIRGNYVVLRFYRIFRHDNRNFSFFVPAFIPRELCCWYALCCVRITKKAASVSLTALSDFCFYIYAFKLFCLTSRHTKAVSIPTWTIASWEGDIGGWKEQSEAFTKNVLLKAQRTAKKIVPDLGPKAAHIINS